MNIPSQSRVDAPNWGPVLSLAGNLGLLLLLCLPWMRIGDKMSGLRLAANVIHQVLNQPPGHGGIEDWLILFRFVAFLAVPAIGAILAIVALLNGRDRDASGVLGLTIAALAIGMLTLRAYSFKNALNGMLPPFWFSFACDVGVIGGGLQTAGRRRASLRWGGSNPAGTLLAPKALVLPPIQGQAILPESNTNGAAAMIKAPDSPLANVLRTLGVLLILVGGGVAMFVIQQATGPGLFSSSRSVEPSDVLAAGTVFFVFLVVGLATYGVGEVLQQVMNILQFLEHQSKVIAPSFASPAFYPAPQTFYRPNDPQDEIPAHQMTLIRDPTPNAKSNESRDITDT